MQGGGQLLFEHQCNFLTFAAHEIVPWCNGSTADFGSACPGSNPGGTA